MQTITRFTEEDFRAMYNPARPLAGDVKGAAYRTNPETALTKRFIQTHPNRAKKLMVMDVDGNGSDWDILEKIYDDETLPEPNYITINPSGGCHVGYFLESSVGTDKGISYFDSVFEGMKIAAESDLSYVGTKTRNPLHPEQNTMWMRAEPFTLKELAAFTKPMPAHFYKKKAKLNTVGSRHLELFDLLSAWAYREWRKPMYETRILVEAQRINMEFDKELPLSSLVSVTRSIERWVAIHFSEEGLSKVQSARGTKSGAVRTEKAVPKNKMLMDMVEAGLSIAEIAEHTGKSYDAAAKAVQRAKKKAANN